MLEPGSKIGGYEIVGVIGRGGMGAVYQAVQLSLQRTVALKVISADYGDDDVFRERFRREGVIQARLDHPHIVPVYEAGEADGNLFLAMRFVKGGNLRSLLLDGTSDVGRALFVLEQVADALDTAHTAGLVHRDVKPQNILVDVGDYAYLADFGLTKAPRERGLTLTGQHVGTLDYTPPEQIKGEEAGPAGDIYALGAVFYECLAGVVPFPRDTDAAVLFAHLSDPVPPLSERRESLPRALDDVLARALAKEPEERYPTAAAFVADARAASDSTSLPLAEPVAETPRHGETIIDPAPQRHELRVAAPEESRRPWSRRRAELVETDDFDAPEPTPVAPPAAVVALPEHPAAGGTARRVVLLAAAVVLVAAVAGIVLGRAHGATPRFVTQDEKLGAVTLTIPVGWRHAQTSTIRGLASANFDGILETGDGGEVAVGVFPARPPSYLPAFALASRAKRVVVQTAHLVGYRYARLRIPGSARASDVYVFPVSGGRVLTAVCTGASECGRVVDSLAVIGSKAQPLEPNAEYGTTLSAALGQLTRAVVAGRRQLTSAKNAAAQAAAARRLAAAYATASKLVRALGTGDAETSLSAAIAGSLGRVGDAYRSLASAAKSVDSPAYAAAEQAVKSRTADAAKQIRRLAKYGYSL